MKIYAKSDYTLEVMIEHLWNSTWQESQLLYDKNWRYLLLKQRGYSPGRIHLLMLI